MFLNQGSDLAFETVEAHKRETGLNQPDPSQPMLPCPSPCVKKCGIDESLYCSGCLRSGREVAAWLTMSDDQRWDLLLELAKRRK